MKRTFTQFDESIPPVVWEHFPEQKKALDRISRVERDLQRMWTSKRRAALATNCEPAILAKVMRIFIKSEFVPNLDKSQSYYLVTIEGRMLESKLSDLHHFGYFFDSIKLSVDKRSGSSSQLSVLEWVASKNPEGRKADCFRFKVFHDKNCFVKFHLTRSSEVQPRYELSQAMREMLPNIRWDPAEDEIFLAIWSYIMDKGLVDSRSRSLITADAALQRALGGADLIQISALRQKIMEHCSPARAIVVEYALSTKPIETSTGSPGRFSRAAVYDVGGRTFDLDVDILDPISYEIVAEVSNSVEQDRVSDVALSELAPTISYLSRSITREALKTLVVCSDESVDPLGIGESSYEMNDMLHSINTRRQVSLFSDSRCLGKGTVPNITTVQTLPENGAGVKDSNGRKSTNVVHVFEQTGIRAPSAVHNYRGYIDLGNDLVFADTNVKGSASTVPDRSNSWVRTAVKAFAPSDYSENKVVDVTDNMSLDNDVGNERNIPGIEGGFCSDRSSTTVRAAS